MTDLPPWLVMFLGMVTIAAVVNGAHKLDQWITSKTNPGRDSRKSSWWVWLIVIAFVGGGLIWTFSHGPVPGGGSYDRWEFARR